jgi:hypothetical protein
MRSKLVLGSAACVLSLLRTGPADAAATLDGTVPLPALVYFDAGGEILRVDHRAHSSPTASLLESPDGCVELPIDRAILHEDTGSRTTVARSREPVHLLGTAEDARRITGQAVERASRWERVLTQRTCRSAAGMSLTLETDEDRMSVLVPRDDRSPTMVEINGHASAVGTEGADYEALVTSVRRPDELASGLV